MKSTIFARRKVVVVVGEGEGGDVCENKLFNGYLYLLGANLFFQVL